MNRNTDLRDLNWGKIQVGKSGQESLNFFSVCESENGKIYYKLSGYNPKTKELSGHECINEVIVSRLLDKLKIPHVNYELINAEINIDGKDRTAVICKSLNFQKEYEVQITIDDYYREAALKNETALEFCKRMGLSEYIYNMIMTDYIIMNADRYYYNIIFLKNMQTGDVRPAPLFDHGKSLLFDCWNEEEIAEFNPEKDPGTG